MTGRRTGRLALLGWVLVVAAAGAGLRWAGDGALAPPALGQPATWGEWVAGRDPVVAAMALLRLLALAGLWYLVAATGVGLVLRVVRADGLVTVADRLTVAPVRRLLVAAVGLSFASGLSPALAVARATPVPAAVVYQLPPTTTTAQATTSTTSPPPTLTMRLLPAPSADPAADPVVAPTPPPAAPSQAGPTWTVQPGECFWSIAEDVLTQAWGRPPSDAEIVPYWRTLIEQNRSLLGDRNNPDLIFPAQVFTVPPPPASST